MDEYLLNRNADILVFKLSDMILENDTIIDKSNIIDIALEILDLVDDNGRKIFKLDNEFKFDKYSILIFKKARERFSEECKSCSDIIDAEAKERIDKTLDLIEYTLENENIIKSSNKVRFITIPTQDDKSLLDYDIDGKGVNLEFGKEKYQTKAPHKYEFRLSQPSEINGQKNAEVILKELEQIEKVLSSDPCIVKHTGKHQPFQSEGSSQVKRNVAACTRIQINQFGENIVAISGIFHKEGQNDLALQSEYEVRKDILSSMKKDLNININECEKKYYEFKTRLIKNLYGSKLYGMTSIYRYMLSVGSKDYEFESKGMN